MQTHLNLVLKRALHFSASAIKPFNSTFLVDTLISLFSFLVSHVRRDSLLRNAQQHICI